MKKVTRLLLGLFLLGIITTNAQISTSTGGATNVLPNAPTTNTNVGIGTTNPTAKLEIAGEVKAKSLSLTSLPDGQVFASIADRNEKSLVLNAGTTLSGSSYYRMFKYFDFPQSNINAKSNFYFALEDRNDFGRFRVVAETGGKTHMFMFNKRQEFIFTINDDGNDNITMALSKPNSSFGIGTTSFTDGTDTYRLSVKGAIRADRVKVYTTWADYVFEKSYKLPTLVEVENHIQEKGHLKDIPSAKEVKEKGIELGEMNKLLLQKVEELTLYMIEMNKEIQQLKVQIKKQ